jgi:integrase
MNTTSKTTVTKLSRGGNAWRIRIDVATYDAAGLRIDRKQTNSTFHGTEQEAELHRLQTLITIGAVKPAPTKVAATTPEEAAQALTLGQYAENWLERRLSTMNAQGQTERGYKALFRLYVIPAFGHLSLAGLTREGILSCFATLVQPHTAGAGAGGNGHAKSGRTGRALGVQTITKIYQMLKAVLQDAADAGLFDGTQLRDIRRRLPSPDSVGDVRALDDEQTQRLLRAAQGHPLGGVIRFALSTGCRRAEICALRWQNVTLTDECDERGGGEVRITEAVADDFSRTWVKEPKTKASRRKITIGRSLAAELAVRRREHERECEQLGTDINAQRVFRNQFGDDLNPGVLTAGVRSLMGTASLGEFSLHSLRHTHASTLLRNGENIRAVSKRLGHSDPAFTLRVYSWAMPAEDARLANSIELALAA